MVVRKKGNPRKKANSPVLSTLEAATLLINLTAFKGDWAAHLDYLENGGIVLEGAGTVLAVRKLIKIDSRYNLQKKLLKKEIGEKVGAMQVRELFQIYECCEMLETDRSAGENP